MRGHTLTRPVHGIIGDVIGAVASMHEGSRNRRAASRQASRDRAWRTRERQAGERFQTEWHEKYGSIQARIRAAQAAGISPLAALGIGGAQAPGPAPIPLGS